MNRGRKTETPSTVQRSRTGSIVLLDTASDDEGERSSVARGSRRRTVLLGLVVAAVVAAVGANIGLAANNDDEATAADGLQAEAVAPPADAEPFEGLRSYGSGEYQRDNRYSEINSAIDAVVVAGTIGSSLDLAPVLFGPAPDLREAPPGNRVLQTMDLDASGNYLAGIYRNKLDLDVLMVGRLLGDDWILEPVSVGIKGFSWHPSDPGVIAYAKPAALDPTETDVAIEDYTRNRLLTRRFRGNFPGRLRLWGDWGIAFDEPGPVKRTTIASFPDAIDPPASSTLVPLVVGLPGRAMGELGSRVLIDGGEAPIFVNTQTAVFEQNQWIDSSAEVISMSGSPDGKFAVVLVAGRGGDGAEGGKVLLLANDPTSVEEGSEFLFSTLGPTAFDWSPDGRFVAGFQPVSLNAEGERVSAASVTVYDLNKALFIGREVRVGGAEPDLRFQVGALAFQEALAN